MHLDVVEGIYQPLFYVCVFVLCQFCLHIFCALLHRCNTCLHALLGKAACRSILRQSECAPFLVIFDVGRTVVGVLSTALRNV